MMKNLRVGVQGADGDFTQFRPVHGLRPIEGELITFCHFHMGLLGQDESLAADMQKWRAKIEPSSSESITFRAARLRRQTLVLPGGVASAPLQSEWATA